MGRQSGLRKERSIGYWGREDRRDPEQEERSALPFPRRTGLAGRTELESGAGGTEHSSRLETGARQSGASPWRTPETP